MGHINVNLLIFAGRQAPMLVWQGGGDTVAGACCCELLCAAVCSCCVLLRAAVCCCVPLQGRSKQQGCSLCEAVL